MIDKELKVGDRFHGINHDVIFEIKDIKPNMHGISYVTIIDVKTGKCYEIPEMHFRELLLEEVKK